MNTAYHKEHVADMIDEVSKCAAKIGLDNEKAKHLSEMVAKSLINRWRGTAIYFGNDFYENRRALHLIIVESYHKGETPRQLARKYDLTESQIYSIIKKSKQQTEACAASH